MFGSGCLLCTGRSELLQGQEVLQGTEVQGEEVLWQHQQLLCSRTDQLLCSSGCLQCLCPDPHLLWRCSRDGSGRCSGSRRCTRSGCPRS